ncbi:MAG: tetratricopeptide repeat protein [Bacteroidia bacterium]
MAQKPKSILKPSVPKTAAKAKKPIGQGFLKRNSFQVGLFLIAFLVFANGIGNDYALDDEFYTAGSNTLTQKGIKGIPAIFKSHTFKNNDNSSYSYRPVTLTTFAIETQLFGEDAHVSHFFNVLLYALTIVLIFSILRKWFVTQGDWFNFFICLIFIVHPLHTEVVDNIKCRDELLAILFMLLTIHAIWKHLETKKIYWLILYPILFWAGMLSKHTAVPFYVLIPLSMWFFTDIKLWKIILYIAPLLITTILTSLFQKHNLEVETREYLPFENPLAGHPGFGQLTATSFYVMGRYLFLHFIPYPLVYYYGSFYVPDVTWSNPIAIASLIIHLALGLWALKELRKKSILGFGLLFYLINAGAYSNLLQRAPGIMAERYTYAASLGFCIVVIVLLARLMKVNLADFRWKSEEFKNFRFVMIALALLFAVRSVWRTEDWKNKETLYGGDMEYLEESVKANMLYGALLSKNALELNFQSRMSDGKGGYIINSETQKQAMNRFKEARIYYGKAAELAPYYHTAWSNLGTTYFFTGETRTALSYFNKGVSQKDDYAEGWFNVAMAYDKLEKPDSAIYAFNRSIRADSAYVSSYEQLSRIIMQQEKDPDKALALLRVAARKKPDSEVPWNNMANIYLQLKDTAQSAAAMERAAEINPGNVQRLYNLAQYYRIKQNMAKYSYYNSLAEEGKKKMQEEQKKNAKRAK